MRETYSFFSREENYHWKNGVHITQKNERDALRFLRERPRDKPFHLTVAFFAPKDSNGWNPQPYSESLYANSTIPVPKTNTDEAFGKLPDFVQVSTAAAGYRGYWGNGLYEPNMKKRNRMISEVDDACRHIVDELKEQGVMDETLIIFTTDNGYFQAEHRIAGKWFPYEESLRVPLIVVDPRMDEDKKGTTNADFTLSVDLASTFLSAAKVPVPPSMQGRDIADLYLDNDGSLSRKPWRTEFYYEHLLYNWIQRGKKNFIPPSEALVRKDYKYLLWRENDYREQLFHVKEDPMEEDDLLALGRAEHVDLISEMQGRFAELKAAAQ